MVVMMNGMVWDGVALYATLLCSSGHHGGVFLIDALNALSGVECQEVGKKRGSQDPGHAHSSRAHLLPPVTLFPLSLDSSHASLLSLSRCRRPTQPSQRPPRSCFLPPRVLHCPSAPRTHVPPGQAHPSLSPVHHAESPLSHTAPVAPITRSPPRFSFNQSI